MRVTFLVSVGMIKTGVLVHVKEPCPNVNVVFVVVLQSVLVDVVMKHSNDVNKFIILSPTTSYPVFARETNR